MRLSPADKSCKSPICAFATTICLQKVSQNHSVKEFFQNNCVEQLFV